MRCAAYLRTRTCVCVSSSRSTQHATPTLLPSFLSHNTTNTNTRHASTLASAVFTSNFNALLTKPATQANNNTKHATTHNTQHQRNKHQTTAHEQVKHLNSIHSKGLKVTAFELMDLIPRITQPGDALIIHKIAKQQGHLVDVSVAGGIYNSLMSFYGKQGAVDNAWKVFEEMNENKIAISAVTYNVLIGVFANNDKLDEALTVFDLMDKAELQPNDRTYSILLNAYCKRQDIANIENILQKMTERSIPLNTLAYTMLVELNLNLNREAEALRLLELMRGSQTTYPDAVTYSALLFYYDKVDQIAKMVQVFRELMKDHESGRFSLSSLPFSRMAKAYNARGLFAEAIQTFQLAQQKGVILSDVLVNLALHAYSMKGNVHGAMVVRRHMAAKYIKFDILGMNALMRVWLLTKEFPKVYTTINNIEMYNLQKDENTYALCIELYARENLFQKVEIELAKMKEKGIPLTEITLKVMARFFQEKAVEYFQKAGWELNTEQQSTLSILMQSPNSTAFKKPPPNIMYQNNKIHT